MSDIIGMHEGGPLIVHDPVQCAGEFCCVHNPSEHHMRDWPQRWVASRYTMFRVCPHDVGHPDPDDIRFKRKAFGPLAAWRVASHICDGCCEVGLCAPASATERKRQMSELDEEETWVWVTVEEDAPCPVCGPHGCAGHTATSLEDLRRKLGLAPPQASS